MVHRLSPALSVDQLSLLDRYGARERSCPSLVSKDGAPSPFNWPNLPPLIRQKQLLTCPSLSLSKALCPVLLLIMIKIFSISVWYWKLLVYNVTDADVSPSSVTYHLLDLGQVIFSFLSEMWPCKLNFHCEFQHHI